MSRALNIRATSEHITNTCAKLGARITAIEALQSGGTRVVLSNSVESAAVSRSYGTKVIQGVVTRQPIRLQKAS
ncbi:MAG: hypothetical protein EOP18_01290 [Rhizobiaceae bacterium]|nr:MAG: hypothetical protein EOP18_01290 [Rhizobiaceae bacterium]